MSEFILNLNAKVKSNLLSRLLSILLRGARKLLGGVLIDISAQILRWFLPCLNKVLNGLYLECRVSL